MDSHVIALLFLIFILQVINLLERKRLLDRLMAKDYTEFKSWDAPKAKVPQKALAKKDNIYI